MVLEWRQAIDVRHAPPRDRHLRNAEPGATGRRLVSLSRMLLPIGRVPAACALSMNSN